MTFNNPTTPVSLDALAVGRSSTAQFITIFQDRNPTTGDVNYPIQQRWFNTALDEEWILVGYNISGEIKTAIWKPISNSSVVTETLTGNTGGPVGVDGANNINVIGDGVTATVAGNPGTHTLTITAITSSSVTETLTGNSGGAVGVDGANNINVVGDGISIEVVGNPGTHTLTIESKNGQLMTGVIPDAHTAPGTSPVVPNSSGDITVTGGQVAAGTTTNVIQTNSLAANTYTVQVQRSQAVASSTLGDNGVSHYNSAQFSVDANGFVSSLGTNSSFSVYSNAAQTNVTGDNTIYTVQYDTINYDRASEFNTGTGIFTAAETGQYFFGTTVEFTGVTNSHTSGNLAIITTNQTSQVGVNPSTAVEFNDTMGYTVTLCTNLTAGQTAFVALNIGQGTKVISTLAKSGNTTFVTFYGFRIL